MSMRAEYTTTVLGDGFEATIHMEFAEGSSDVQAWFDFLRNRTSGPRELVFEDGLLIIRPVSEGEPMPRDQTRLEGFAHVEG